MNDEQFEKLVSEAIDSLDEDYLKELDNVAIVINDLPTRQQLVRSGVQPGRGTLFGLYEGVPKTKRGNNYNLVAPDKITVFKVPLLRAAHNNTHLKALIKNTVWHEIAHHFGLGHQRIHKLERAAKSKRISENKVEYVQSELLKDAGVKHAWFTRNGGVSDHPFYSANVSHRKGDRVENVVENRRRLLNSLDLDDKRMAFAYVVSKDKLAVVKSDQAGMEINDVDALATDTSDLPIGLSVADCLSTLIYDPKQKVIANVHSGWAGLSLQNLCKAIRELEDSYRSKPGDLLAAIGPSIGPKYYEVRDDVAKLFSEKYLKPHQDRYLLDLWAAAEDQLKDAGVNQIDNLRIDTFTDERFFSHRREQGPTGRFLSVISL